MEFVACSGGGPSTTIMLRGLAVLQNGKRWTGENAAWMFKFAAGFNSRVFVVAWVCAGLCFLQVFDVFLSKVFGVSSLWPCQSCLYHQWFAWFPLLRLLKNGGQWFFKRSLMKCLSFSSWLEHRVLRPWNGGAIKMNASPKLNMDMSKTCSKMLDLFKA